MPLNNDVTLNGVDYTIVPGSYRKRNAATTAAVNPRDVRRLTLGPFGRGQRQALREGADDAGAGWDSVGVGPCFDGQGIEPFPAAAGYTDVMLDTPTATSRAYGAIVGENAYIGLRRRIYKSVSVTAGVWSNFTVATDLGAGYTISGLAYYQDDLVVLLSTGQDMRKLTTATNAVTIWRAGERGVHGVGYKGQLVYAPLAANNSDELRLSGTKWNGNAVTHKRYLDGPVVRMGVHGGKVAVATRQSLYLFDGEETVTGWTLGITPEITVRATPPMVS